MRFQSYFIPYAHMSCARFYSPWYKGITCIRDILGSALLHVKLLINLMHCAGFGLVHCESIRLISVCFPLEIMKGAQSLLVPGPRPAVHSPCSYRHFTLTIAGINARDCKQSKNTIHTVLARVVIKHSQGVVLPLIRPAKVLN